MMKKKPLVWLFVFLNSIVCIVVLSIYQNGHDDHGSSFILIERKKNHDKKTAKRKRILDDSKDCFINQTLNYQFSKSYPAISECTLNYEKWHPSSISPQPPDYSLPASNDHQLNLRMVRGVIVYFPLDRFVQFYFELKWLYRSWLEMMKYEPAKWRTDLIVFLEVSRPADSRYRLLNELGCSFSNKRKSKLDNPMCTLIACAPIKSRQYKEDGYSNLSSSNLYQHLLRKVNIFDDSEDNLRPFYRSISVNLKHYGNIDSIIVAFDGHKYFKEAQFDFLLKSDIDVFLTPTFSKWMPRNCNDFYAGNGGYSTDFNLKRLRGASKDLNLEHASQMNIGSTWFGTPDQLRIVSYLTLFSMLYLSEEEFSPVERAGKFGINNWPHWHYGVLSMYGSDMAINHFMSTKEFNVVILPNHFDVPTTTTDKISRILHLHVFHTEQMFSKFKFKAGLYDKLLNESRTTNDNSLAMNYCLKMALEAKFTLQSNLCRMLAEQSQSKI